MVATLETMPVELQHEVLGQLESTADLRSLCLVSQQISAIARQHLYYHFVFPRMSPDVAERLCLTLAKSNGLLPLVKIFRLGMCLRFCSKRLEAAFLTLLSAFPDDCLNEFNLDGHILRHSHQVFLWSHQQRVHGLELTVVSKQRRRINKDSFPDNCLNEKLEHLKKSGFAKRMGPTPSSLRVHGLISPKLWGSAIISQRRLPLTNMKHLSLDEVTLNGSFLNSLPHLTHLALRNCPSAGKCIDGFRGPSLKAFYFFYDPYEPNVLVNLAHFLSRFQGLETLAVRDIWRYRQTGAEQRGTLMLGNAIEEHRASITFLLVHFNHQVYANPQYFDPIVDAATNCQKLIQLGLSMSPRRLQLACVRILDQLPSLVTLRIDMDHSLSFLKLWHLSPIAENPAYSRVIGRIAAEAMEAAASRPPSKFALLSVGYAVGTNLHVAGPKKRKQAGGSDNLGTCECQHDFAHSDAFVFRRNGSEAIRISPNKAKFLIPESDIINFRERFFNCD